MTNEEGAQIVRQTADHMRLPPGMAKLAIEIAARAVERGRHLTDAEKLENFRAAILEEDGDEAAADKLTDFVANRTDALHTGGV